MSQEELETTDLMTTMDRTSNSEERLGGRYAVYEKLGEGGMSTVYRAYDQKNAGEVAIKFMKSDLGGSARRRFFREFNTIAGIQHPCCLRVFEIGETKDAPYFTMELHPGRAVDSILGDPPEMMAPMLVDLTLAVDYIHSQGIVHRDIKPSNVLVQRTGDREQGQLSCKLADFGLAKFYQLDSSLTAERGMVGTLAYCAPEQIEAANIDHRADLYAIGILAFELLSGGQHPFARDRAQGANSLLQAQLTVDPPKLMEVNPNIPEAVCDVVSSYLAKDPELRPSSALPLRRVLCEQYGVEVDTRLEELSSPSDVVLNAVGFVCREHELKQVDQFLQASMFATPTAHDDPRLSAALLLFTGDPGTGKTSTMQEAVRRATGMGYRVFEGRCFEGATSSFQPVIEIVRSMLSSLARSRKSVDESTHLADFQMAHSESLRLEQILHEYQSELLLVAPELRRWLPGQAHEPVFQNDSEYIFRAVATMFVELSQITPLCLCFDDIQWADNSTLTFLRHLAAAISQAKQIGNKGDKSDGQGCTIALMCTGRSGYASLAGFRARMESQSLLSEVELNVLTTQETHELLALRLGCLASSVGEGLVAAIDRLCQGNPFFISETIREWHSRGMIVRTSDGWQRVHASLDDESSLPSSVRTALRTRINDLSEVARMLVPAAAAIGRIVDLDLLGQIVQDVGESDLLDAVEELLTKRVFVETNTASKVAFTHDLLRETIQNDLSQSRKRSLHRRIASVLEELRDSEDKRVSPFVLANHYLAGELKDRAFNYLLEAAELAARAYAFEDAFNLLEQAEANLPSETPDEAMFRLYSLMSLSSLHIANLSQASAAGKKSLQFTDSPEDRGRAYDLLGRIEAARAQTAEAEAYFNEALEALGLGLTKNRMMQFLAIQYNLFAFHFIPAPILALFNRTRSMGSKQEIACGVLYEYAHLVAVSDIITYTQVCSANVRLAKPLSSNLAKSVAFAKYGLNLSFSGVNARMNFLSTRSRSLSVRYGSMGEAYAKKESRSDILASVQTSLGFSLYCMGQLEDAEQKQLEAEKTLRRCRDRHTSYCYHYLRHVYSVRGEPQKIIDAGEKELEMAAATQDSELMGWSHYGLAHGYALAGRLTEALESAEESVRLTLANDSSFCSVSLMERGFALMQAGRYGEAVESFKAAHEWMKKRWFFFEIAMPTFPRIVEALLGSEWHRPAEVSAMDLRSARKYARYAHFFSFSFPNIRPHTWRSLGRMHFAAGKPRKARKCFQRACSAALSIGARYDHARTLFDMGVAFAELASSKQQALIQLEELGAVMPAVEMEAANTSSHHSRPLPREDVLKSSP